MEDIRRIPVSAPLLDGNESKYVNDCLATNWISSQGDYVRRFEQLFEQYHDGRKSVSVSNGTVALHLALVALGIGPGDEVIVPDLTFAASVNAIIYTGAKPVLVDVDPATWNISPKAVSLAITEKTKAIMPVHLYGQPCDMVAIVEIANNNSLFIVEDCAEALGSQINNKPVGVFGDVATFSFYGNKTITTGEGGMLVFKEAELAEKAAVLRDHGMSKTKRYWHEYIGHNYRLTNIQAAIGVAQFERLQYFIYKKRHIAKQYSKTLIQAGDFILPVDLERTIHSHWLYTFLVKPDAPYTRDKLMAFLSDKGIDSRPSFFPLHTMPPYGKFGFANRLTVSQQVSNSGLSLPSSSGLSDEDIEYVCESIKLFQKMNNKNETKKYV